MRSRLKAVLSSAVVLVPLLVLVQLMQAQNFKVLYSFKGKPDGQFPYAGLVRDAAGNLYGTTAGGGVFATGTVFKLGRDGRESALYSFTGGSDGGPPSAGSLVRDAAGNLYGTAGQVVFKLDTTGKETALYTFTGGFDGGNPSYAGLIMDSAGNLYGTAETGGDLNCNGGSGCGVVFKLDKTGKQTVLYSFTGPPDGANPVAPLIRDSAGNLYGTTNSGGNASGCDCGTVFKLDNKLTETVLYTFTGGSDGAFPWAGLLRDKKGNLYGTTYQDGGVGGGVVFRLDKSGTLKVLHSFAGNDGGGIYAGLVRDREGNLYGTTYGGGADGRGVVFKLDKTGKETVLHAFTDGPDGGEPFGGLVRDSVGNLYGTTVQGGIKCGGDFFCGVVFRVKP